MLIALRECRDILPHLSHEIWFAGFMGEEAGQEGVKALSAKERFDFAIVGEPTGLQTVNTHKGSVWLTLRARGRAAHASRPEIGENAIEKMLEALGVLRSEVLAAFASQRDEILGPADLQHRDHSGRHQDQYRARPLRGPSRYQDPSRSGSDAVAGFLGRTLSRSGVRSESFRSVEDRSRLIHSSACWNHAERAARERPGFAMQRCLPPRELRLWRSDLGSIDQAHTADEWISLADLEAGVAFFKTLLQKAGSLQ